MASAGGPFVIGGDAAAAATRNEANINVNVNVNGCLDFFEITIGAWVRHRGPIGSPGEYLRIPRGD